MTNVRSVRKQVFFVVYSFELLFITNGTERKTKSVPLQREFELILCVTDARHQTNDTISESVLKLSLQRKTLMRLFHKLVTFFVIISSSKVPSLKVQYINLERKISRKEFFICKNRKLVQCLLKLCKTVQQKICFDG